MSFPRPTPVASPFPRTYSAPAHLREAIRDLHETSSARSVATAAADHLAIFGLIALSLAAYLALPLARWLALVVNLLALVGIARFQRGLECLVHEGSHYNWDRSHRRRNDLAANLLTALPVISVVDQYRVGHFLHHRGLGTAEDPDLRRYVELDVEALDRSSGARFALGIARRLPRYLVGWWGAIGTDRVTVLKALAWHGLVIVSPVALLAGPWLALVAWAQWVGGFVLVLPVLRFIGEAGEHQYTGAENLFDATMVNDGWVHRMLIHPHNDGYHVTHHLWPGVPHHKLRQLHRLLEQADPEGYARRLRRRTRILEEPPPSQGDAVAPVGAARRSA